MSRHDERLNAEVEAAIELELCGADAPTRQEIMEMTDAEIDAWADDSVDRVLLRLGVSPSQFDGRDVTRDLLAATTRSTRAGMRRAAVELAALKALTAIANAVEDPERRRELLPELIAQSRRLADAFSRLDPDPRTPLEPAIASAEAMIASWGAEFARLNQADLEERRRSRIAARREPPTRVETPVCAEDGCSRDRVFFDEGGVGYCKRHGAARGLRPHGKVT